MRKAFTLVELLVSIAMVLILILGVNAVFKVASDTVNAGQALSAAVRDGRGVEGVLYTDFRSAVMNGGPMLLIRSEVVKAFRNAVDEREDGDGDPLTVDMDADNEEGEAAVPGEVTPTFVYNTRNHRVDRVSFFGNHLYRRQTGTHSATVSRFVDSGTSNEAYIWYGHLSQPDFNREMGGHPGRFWHVAPGHPKSGNPDNFYATDWILGRSVMLLREVPAPAGVPDPPNYFPYVPASVGVNLSPLEPETEAKDVDADGVKDRIGWSRYDLAQTSIDRFRQTLQAHIAAVGQQIGGAKTVWYELLGGGPGALMGHADARVQGCPYPDKPLTPQGVARTVPVLVRGCTHFTVEFAGDYLAQDPNNGAVTGCYLHGPGGVDGQIDFMKVVDQPYPSAPPQSVRRIRWYGLPRNVDLRDGMMIRGGPGADGKQSNLYDVIPLRDLLLLAPGVPSVPTYHFEHFENLDPRQDYSTVVITDPEQLGTVRYYAAWGPEHLAPGSLTRPKMLRITMTVDDPNGRITEGQTYEYIIELP